MYLAYRQVPCLQKCGPWGYAVLVCKYLPNIYIHKSCQNQFKHNEKERHSLFKNTVLFLKRERENKKNVMALDIQART